jgi:hypothetical protein
MTKVTTRCYSIGWGKKQSTISPFLKFDLPEGNKAQILDFTNDLILNDS